MVENCDFLKVFKNPYPKNQFLFTMRLFFSTYKIFSGRGWFFLVSIFKGKYFNEKMSSLVGLKKSYSISRKSTAFGHFWLPRSTFEVDFLNVQGKIQKSLVSFLEKVVRNIVLKFELSTFKKARRRR